MGECNIIAELLNNTDMTEKDLKELLLDTLSGNSKKKKTKEKEKEVLLSYTGKVTFTCQTCEKVFNRSFTTNIKDQHISKKAPTCAYCEDELKNKTKEDLVSIILQDRKDWYSIC